MKRVLRATALCACLLGVSYSPAISAEFKIPKAVGELGEVLINPSGLAPLTAVIKRRGNDLSDIVVTVKGKPDGGTDITYKVSKAAFLTNDGIPVWGLYPNLVNTVEVSYVKNGKPTKESYKIEGAPLKMTSYVGKKDDRGAKITATKTSDEFKNRLYLLQQRADARQHIGWLQEGGAAGFDKPSDIYVVDAKGDVRWYLDTEKLFDLKGYDITRRGSAMVSWQGSDGNILFLQGQRYISMDMIGTVSFDRVLPYGYQDASHEILEGKNGNYFIRVAKKDYKNGSNYVTTVRDHIIEVNKTGQVVDEWDMNKILPNNRDVLLKALDPKAVCENVDMEHTTAEKIEVKAPFGDIIGIGAGRNWAHINSISYDASDDSIVGSFRHQGIIKIGRDKKVKWILASEANWPKEYKKYLLKPVDSKGKALQCDENGDCGDSFEYSWTQHTAYMVPELGRGYLSVFDNGEGRNNSQPATSESKYSRAVGYKIDEKNMTVQQDWQYGKERGYAWYSQVTSNVNYMPSTKSWFVTTSDVYLMQRGKDANPTMAFLDEIRVKDGKAELLQELKIEFNSKEVGYLYRANVIDQEKLFAY